jgi:hypothetical protein
MALDSSFAAAYIDNGKHYRLLGRRLRPFSLWHVLLLQALDSPFIKGGSISLFDLKTAIGICSLRYRNSKIKRPWFPFKVGVGALRQEVARFVEYVEDYLSKPEYTVIPWDTKHTGPAPVPVTPPPHIIATAFNVAHGARITIGEAWDLPIGESYICESMYLRAQGAQLDFLSDEERKFQQELKAAGIK